MTNALPAPQVMHDIHVEVVSPEEGSLGMAEFWAGDRLIAFTRIEESDLALRIEPSHDPVVVGAHALAEALAEANRLIALY
jgi:hypothetical protein